MLTALKKLFTAEKVNDPQLHEWHIQNTLSPDVWFLEQFQYQLFFFPDEMMQGRRQHNIIKDVALGGEPLHPGCFTASKYTFWKKDLGVESFPIALPETYQPSNWLRKPPVAARIQGELYAIRPHIIWKKLDILRHNRVQFQRRRVDISIPYKEVRYNDVRPLPIVSDVYVRSVRAWMYEGIPDYWDDQIGDMFIVKEMNQYEFDQPQKWIDKYYKFE